MPPKSRRAVGDNIVHFRVARLAAGYSAQVLEFHLSVSPAWVTSGTFS
jgi:hypothetical protein